MRRPLTWTAVAAILLAGASWMTREQQAMPKAAVEPDLFPFLKATNGMDPDSPDAKRGMIAHDSTHHDSPRDKLPGQAQPSSLRQLADVQQAARELRAKGASDDEIYRMRAEALSPETAARLAEMERAESMWQARVDAYLAERNALSGGDAQQAALQQLRDARFSAEEQKLLAAYEPSRLPQLMPPDLPEANQ
ncbi:lipase secretion chaperone [Noviherbaspirillum sp.]|uniref:lipase secretion chaperone n=1 Tax=Noviherbaspirillum sp. TaxID=1926288 RepID=UPI002B48D91E|nr:lipase secretion chaperone [Noviherbaspirillum sp.]HJV83003.1 lipase secretion chaperone [Noviherbaspirillum sp.]